MVKRTTNNCIGDQIIQNIKIEEDKLKEILYNNLDMLFEKLEAQNRAIDEIDLKSKN